jgi:hypothetical protein
VPDATYAWNNTLNDVPSRIVANVGPILEGRDFFNDPKLGYAPVHASAPADAVTGTREQNSVKWTGSRNRVAHLATGCLGTMEEF